LFEKYYNQTISETVKTKKMLDFRNEMIK